MKTRRRVWVTVLVVLIAAVTVAVLVFHQREPEYQGKPLSYWLEQLPMEPLHDQTPSAAEAAVRAIGTNALPFLLRSLTAEDSRLTEALIKFDKSQSVIPLGIRPAEARAVKALMGYGVLAEIAEPAIPDLVAVMNGSNDVAADYAGIVLPYLGSAGIEAVAKLLSSTNSWSRREAAFHLASPVFSGGNQGRYLHFAERYRRQADVVVPALVEMLKDADTNVAYSATTALGILRLRPDEVIPLLTNLAANESAPLKVRGGAIAAVGRFGKTAESVVPFLETFTNAATDKIRVATSNALWRIGGGTSNIIEAVK